MNLLHSFLLIVSLSTQAAFAAPLCGHVKEPLSAEQLSAQLKAMEGTYLEAGATRTKLSDGREGYARLFVKVEESGVTAGQQLYTELYLPPVGVEIGSVYSPANARFGGPFESAGGKLLIERETKTSNDLNCFTFGISVQKDLLFISPQQISNYLQDDHSAFAPNRRLERVKK